MANELHGSSTPKYEIMHVLQNEVFFNQNIDCKQTETETYCIRNGTIFPIPDFFFQINTLLPATSNIPFQIGVIKLELHQRKEQLSIGYLMR